MPHVALVVRDYDEALAFYVGKRDFELVEDSYQLEQDKRWVTIRPPGAGPDATTILLLSAAIPTMLRIVGTLGGSARASTDHQAKYIGDQAGDRVFAPCYALTP